MKNQVLVIGNMKRFLTFVIIYTLLIAAIVSSVFVLINYFHHQSLAAQHVETMISLSESALLI